MLEIRFAGHPRFVGFVYRAAPDNGDAPPERQAMAGAALPQSPVQGVRWTGHRRLDKTLGNRGKLPHLWLVK